MQLSNLELVRTRYQDIFVIYKNDEIVGSSLRLYGEYQQIELDILLQLVNSSKVVYDIGSNVGYHATAFASRAGTVYCFEANPSHFKVLQTNIGNRTNCLLYNVALSDTDGDLLVESFDLTKTGNYGAVKVGANSGIRVACRTLDSMNMLPPDLIKIDVEGHELNVFRGAYNTIKKHMPAIYFEAQETTDLSKIYYMLTELGYSLGWCAVPNYNPDNYNKNTNNIFLSSGIFSIIALPPKIYQPWPLPVLGPDDSVDKVLQRINQR